MIGGFGDNQVLGLLPNGGIDDLALIVGVNSGHLGIDRRSPALEGVARADICVAHFKRAAIKLEIGGRCTCLEVRMALVGEDGLVLCPVSVDNGVGLGGRLG